METKQLDLGTLSTLTASPLTLGAPSRVTRGVWLLGVGACLVFLWSIALPIGWLQETGTGIGFGRLPYLSETLLWLLPLLLATLSLGMALGGVRLTFGADTLELRSLWPSSTHQSFRWAKLRYARFWEEQSRNGETLYAIRLVFESAELSFRVPNKKVWLALKERLAP